MAKELVDSIRWFRNFMNFILKFFRSCNILSSALRATLDVLQCAPRISLINLECNGSTGIEFKQITGNKSYLFLKFWNRLSYTLYISDAIPMSNLPLFLKTTPR
jgi:hypothetical protein